MVVNVNSQRIASVVRQVAAVGMVVVGSLQNSGTVPGSYGWILAATGGALLAVEHYVSDPSTGTPAPTAPGVPVGPTDRSAL